MSQVRHRFASTNGLADDCADRIARPAFPARVPPSPCALSVRVLVRVPREVAHPPATKTLCTTPNGLIVRQRSAAPAFQRSGIGEDEPEASFDCFSAGVAGGAAADSAGAGAIAAGGGVTGASAGGCSCVHAAKSSAIITAGTERASFIISKPNSADCVPRRGFLPLTLRRPARSA
jgi:hypothetical protein